jgi:hypothetical protein
LGCSTANRPRKVATSAALATNETASAPDGNPEGPAIGRIRTARAAVSGAETC